MNILYCPLLQVPSGGAGRTVSEMWLHLDPMIYQLEVHRKQVSYGYVTTISKMLFCIFFFSVGLAFLEAYECSQGRRSLQSGLLFIYQSFYCYVIN